MTWHLMFGLTNAVALAGWLALALLPRGPKVKAIVLYACVAMLCLAYVAMFVGLFGGFADPARVAGTAAPDPSDYSVEGIRALFMSDGGIVLGWTHYLAFDLFVGLWIAQDADDRGFARLVQIPFLFLTLMAGPIGLLAWLIFRERRTARAAQPAE